MFDFGELLKELRQNAKLTQQQLGDRLFVSKNMISYYENSHRPPSADFLVQIADVFHVSVDYLLGREKKEPRLNLNGLPNKDIEFVQSVVTFLQGKNDEQNLEKKEAQKQNKNDEQNLEKNEAQKQNKNDEQNQEKNEAQKQNKNDEQNREKNEAQEQKKDEEQDKDTTANV